MTNTEKLVVWLDFDNTLANTTKAMIDTYKHLTGEEPATYEDYTWNLKTAYPNYDKEIIHKLFDIEYFFDVLELFPFAYTTLEKFSDKFELKICSYGTPRNLQLKKQWILKNLPMIKEENIVLLEQHKKDFDKSVCEGYVMIDDRLEPLLTCKCKYKILFRYGNKPYEWQEGYEKLLEEGKIDFVSTEWDKLKIVKGEM